MKTKLRIIFFNTILLSKGKCKNTIPNGQADAHFNIPNSI